MIDDSMVRFALGSYVGRRLIAVNDMIDDSMVRFALGSDIGRRLIAVNEASGLAVVCWQRCTTRVGQQIAGRVVNYLAYEHEKSLRQLAHELEVKL
jgi:hypothetical protein